MSELNPIQEKVRKQVRNPWKFGLFLFLKVPMGFIAGMRIVDLSASKCVTSVPFKFLTKNPFKSMYFAVQAMAAELSTAATCMLAVQGQKPSIAYIIVDCKAQFKKKATAKVFFTCDDVEQAFIAVEKCKTDDNPQLVTFTTIGKMADGTEVAEFKFTWSFKRRQS
ncbi:MAG: DUF4442 domain-containing protein [Cyclobacteriaceae bacterium]